MNCLNYCEQQLTLKNTKISKVPNSIINSNKIHIDDLDDSALRDIFLLCHFPDLNELTIGDYNLLCNSNRYYEKCLSYLPYSCPKLRSLFIEGRINSFDFLYHFRELNKCEIRSINDSIGYFKIYNPYIVKKNERDRIVSDSKCNSNSKFDIHLAIYEKLQSIIKSLSLVSYSEDEKNLYINNNVEKILLNSLDNFNDKPVEHIYLYDVNKENLELTEKNIDNNLKDYFFVNNTLFESEKQINRNYIKSKSKITTCKPFIYHPSLIPIVFSEKALSHKEYINQAIGMEDMFTFAHSGCNDIEDIFPDDYNDTIDTLKEKIRLVCLNEKKDEYFSLLMKIVIDNYNNFNIEELIHILRLIEKTNYSIIVEPYYKIPLLNDNNNILKDIDEKTDKNFTKYLDMTRMVNKQQRL